MPTDDYVADEVAAILDGMDDETYLREVAAAFDRYSAERNNTMIEARFTCQSKKVSAYGHIEYEFSPVYANNDENHPNYRFWKATPSGKLTLGINANETQAEFEVGTEYRLLFEAMVPEPA